MLTAGVERQNFWETNGRPYYVLHSNVWLCTSVEFYSVRCVGFVTAQVLRLWNVAAVAAIVYVSVVIVTEMSHVSITADWCWLCWSVRSLVHIFSSLNSHYTYQPLSWHRCKLASLLYQIRNFQLHAFTHYKDKKGAHRFAKTRVSNKLCVIFR